MLFLFSQVTEDSGLEELVAALAKAISEGEWGVLAAVIMLLLVWLATKMPGLKDVFKGPVRLWVTAVSTVLAAAATSFLVTSNWLTAIVSAVTVAAGGLLGTLIVRSIKGEPIDADGDGKLDSLPPPTEPTE